MCPGISVMLELPCGAEDFGKGQIQAYPLARGSSSEGHALISLAANCLKVKHWEAVDKMFIPSPCCGAGCLGVGAVPSRGAAQPGRDCHCRLDTSVLPTLHILPALVFSCPAVSWDNNLLSCLGLCAGCWHGRPAPPWGLHPVAPGRDWGAEVWGRPETLHGPGRVCTPSLCSSCGARGQQRTSLVFFQLLLHWAAEG